MAYTAHIDRAIAPDYSYDPKSGRYRYISGPGKGQFAPREAVLAITKDYVNTKTQELKDLGTALSDGKIDLDKFQDGMSNILRVLHVNQAILGRGGLDRMQPADWLAVGRTLKQQYRDGKGSDGQKFGVKWLAADIKAGLVSPAQLQNRLTMYAQASKISYHKAVQANQVDLGYTLMQRFLGQCKNHCPSCYSYSVMGKRPVGDLPLIGEKCECGSNCCCSIKYYKQ